MNLKSVPLKTALTGNTPVGSRITVKPGITGKDATESCIEKC
jgi:hypothetical protein